jgi:lipoyl-dependent peroxiredoxin subunit D
VPLQLAKRAADAEGGLTPESTTRRAARGSAPLEGERSMTTLDSIRDALPDYARDLKLNLSTVLAPAGAPDLNEAQIWAVALSSAIAARNVDFARGIERLAAPHLGDAGVNAARAAAAVMGMNNIYYRFLHLVEDAEYQQLPARLRMNVIANPGIPRVDFELCSLAVSAINGCGTCVASHERQLRQHGISREAVQSAVRIASVVHAVAGVLESEAGRSSEAGTAAAA